MIKRDDDGNIIIVRNSKKLKKTKKQLLEELRCKEQLQDYYENELDEDLEEDNEYRDS